MRHITPCPGKPILLGRLGENEATSVRFDIAHILEEYGEAEFTLVYEQPGTDEGYPVTESDGSLRPCRPEDIVILMRAPGSRTEAFAQALRDEGFRRVELIDTTRGLFMSPAEAKWMALSGSTLLVGKK